MLLKPKGDTCRLLSCAGSISSPRTTQKTYIFKGENSSPSNLSSRQRLDPRQGQVETDHDDANDPKGAGVVGAVVHEPKNDGKDDAAEVAAGARDARDEAVGVRVHVRHEREVGAVAGLEEDGHEGDQAKHLGRRVVRVDAADDDEQRARDASAQHDPELLAPQVVARRLEDEVADDAAEGPRDKVEEAEHGGPVGRARLAQPGEVLEVVGAQDRVDGQLAAKGAEVGRHVEGRLQAEEHPDPFGERRLGHDLALGRRAHLLL